MFISDLLIYFFKLLTNLAFKPLVRANQSYIRVQELS